MKLPDKLYDVLKYVCQIGLPAVITFLAAVLALVGVDPKIIAIITGILAATDTLLGSLLGISTASYYKQLREQTETSAEEG